MWRQGIISRRLLSAALYSQQSSKSKVSSQWERGSSTPHFSSNIVYLTVPQSQILDKRETSWLPLSYGYRPLSIAGKTVSIWERGYLTFQKFWSTLFNFNQSVTPSMTLKWEGRYLVYSILLYFSSMSLGYDFLLLNCIRFYPFMCLIGFLLITTLRKDWSNRQGTHPGLGYPWLVFSEVPTEHHP